MKKETMKQTILLERTLLCVLIPREAILAPELLWLLVLQPLEGWVSDVVSLASHPCQNLTTIIYRSEHANEHYLASDMLLNAADLRNIFILQQLIGKALCHLRFTDFPTFHIAH